MRTIEELVKEVTNVFPQSGNQPTMTSVASVLSDNGLSTEEVDEYLFQVINALPTYVDDSFNAQPDYCIDCGGSYCECGL